MHYKHYSLLVMTAVRFSWQRTCQNTYQHAQKSPVAVWYQSTTEMNSVWTLFIMFFHRYHVWFTFRLQPRGSNEWSIYTHHSRNCVFILHWYYLLQVRSWMLFQDIRIQWWTQVVFWDWWLCIVFHNFRTPLRMSLNHSKMPSGNVL